MLSAPASNTEVECSCIMALCSNCMISQQITAGDWPERLDLFYQLPMYAQLNFPNYFTECFINTVNLLGKWPLAFRKTVGLNCSVNVTGRQGCGLELDAFVEAEIVQPLKTYVSGTVSIWLIRQDYSMFAFYFIPVRYCRSNCLIFLMFSTCTIHFVQVQNILLLT